MNKPRNPKSNLCRWNCSRTTTNRSGICDFCWKVAELLRSPTEEGYQAWLEQRRAKEAALSVNPKRQAASAKANAAKAAKLTAELSASEL